MRQNAALCGTGLRIFFVLNSDEFSEFENDTPSDWLNQLFCNCAIGESFTVACREIYEKTSCLVTLFVFC